MAETFLLNGVKAWEREAEAQNKKRIMWDYERDCNFTHRRIVTGGSHSEI